MNHKISVLFLIFALFFFAAGLWSVEAQTNIYVSPNAKSGQSEGLISKLFVTKDDKKASQSSFLSKLFGTAKNPPKQTAYQELKSPGALADFNFDKFYAAYEKSKYLDQDLLLDSGDGPKNLEELDALAAARQAPVMQAMVEDRIKNRQKMDRFIAQAENLPKESTLKAANKATGHKFIQHQANTQPPKTKYWVGSDGSSKSSASKRLNKVFTDY